MYFFYQNPLPPCGRPFLKLPGIVDVNGKPSEKFEQARRINSAVKALGPTLMSLESSGVTQVYFENTTAQVEGLLQTAGCGLRSVSPYYYTVGCFTASGAGAGGLAAGTRAVMVVNREHAHTALATVEFDVPMAKVQEVSQHSGLAEAVVDFAPAMNGTQQLLGPGRGRLYLLPPG